MTLCTTVIIVTLNRADCVRRCLRCLHDQSPRANQVIVVDASPDDLTLMVAADFPDVVYLRNDNGYGRMTASRNIGLLHSTGDIIAFLDDDAFAHEGWLKGVLEAYDSPDVGAVGGRALNNQAGEAMNGVDRIGKLTADGMLEGWFAADPGHITDVDHIMGCNMSFRREVLAVLGGFREDYPGISGVREDSDMCVRIRRAGYRIRFTPFAVATHIGAPQAVGKRFDIRYGFYAARNHLVLLIRNFGFFSPIVIRYGLSISVHFAKQFLTRVAAFRLLAAVAHLATSVVGSALGLLSGLWILIRCGRDPVRRDAGAQRIRSYLEQSSGVGIAGDGAKRRTDITTCEDGSEFAEFA
jgi:GT2 family glycosyltransferase